MPPISMSHDELLALPATVPLETAARAFGVGRTKAHELVRDGTFPCPVLPLGRKQIVTRSALFAVLGIDQKLESPEAPDALPEPSKGSAPPVYVLLAVPVSPECLDELWQNATDWRQRP
ncbi:MAG TPA: hypothetical protein VNF47_23165 [Streptosporangiaceae bacterium]|nr:hypothetical protein [Streptosporangiaceae bacterium]